MILTYDKFLERKIWFSPTQVVDSNKQRCHIYFEKVSPIITATIEAANNSLETALPSGGTTL